MIVIDEDGEAVLHECNECGVLVFIENELCLHCYDEHIRNEQAAAYA